MGQAFDSHMSATGMWVEKYRPKKITEIVGQTEIIGSLSALIKDPTDMPHLMFSGSRSWKNNYCIMHYKTNFR